MAPSDPRVTAAARQVSHRLDERSDLHDSNGVAFVPVAILRWRFVVGVGLVVLVLGCQRQERGMEAMAKAARESRWDDVQRIGRNSLTNTDLDGRFLQAMGLAAIEQGNDEEARRLMSQSALLRWPGCDQVHAAVMADLLRRGQIFDATEHLQSWLAMHPDDVQGRRDLAGICATVGWMDLAVDQLRALAISDQIDPDTLIVLAQPHQVRPDVEFCTRMAQRHPDDARIRLGFARDDFMDNRLEASIDQCQAILRDVPDFAPAWKTWGQALLRQGQVNSMRRWLVEAPEPLRDDAIYWQIRASLDGDAATDHWALAARFSQFNDPEILARWANTIAPAAIVRSLGVEAIRDRSNRLTRLHDLVMTFNERQGQSQSTAMEIADVMVQLGRFREADGWLRYASVLTQDPLDEMSSKRRELQSELAESLPLQRTNEVEALVALAALAATTDTSTNPQHDKTRRDVAASEPVLQPTLTPDRGDPATSPSDPSSIHLVNVAAAVNLQHQTEIGRPDGSQGHWIFESNGGGIAALDYDLNGWPDLVATMLNGRPLCQDSDPDRLFRNLDGRFELTDAAATGLVNAGYSQGLAVGDLNADGFPDIACGNIGENEIFINNGDGTFQSAARQVGVMGSRWSTSMAIGDFNGDGLSDLFEVNYCGGDRPFEEACRNRISGKLSSCSPSDFEAEADRLWLMTRQGVFDSPYVLAPDSGSLGRGLGLVAGNLDAVPGLEVFVANDMTSNHLWAIGRGGDSGEPLMHGAVITERGVLTGVAVSRSGTAQASMGIAAGDMDGDWDVDLFVTHFMDDHNTFYEQILNGVWQDRSYQKGLGRSSERWLGFGTQLVDLDLDRHPELIIANGHVSDLADADVAYQMPPQLYRRQSDGSWDELDRATLGAYFEAEHLGRCVIQLDFDRDGMPDLAITHLFEPVALLTNQSDRPNRMVRFSATDAGHPRTESSAAINLVGVQSERDAIGTEAFVTIGNQTTYHQLFAGDGYLGSNQRTLQLSLGDSRIIDTVELRWPSGTRSTIGPIAGGDEILLVEGDEPYSLTIPD